MARYLLTVTDDDAARLERWLGFRAVITPASGGSEPVAVAGLDAITDEEYEFIARRLRSSGPLYHAGGPSSATPPAVSLPELRWAPYQEFGIPDPASESYEPPTVPFMVGATGYRGDDIIVYWKASG